MSEDKWVKGTVAIRVMKRDIGHTTEEVSCIRKGIWAIHKFNSRTWSLTHIPSGCKFWSLRTQGALKQMVEELNTIEWANTPGALPHFVHIEASKPILLKYKDDM